MPKWLPQFDPTAKNFDLLRTTGRSIGRQEVIVLVRNEIFVMSISQNRLKDVFASTHLSSTTTPCVFKIEAAAMGKSRP
jgi:hypothetical protein